MREIVKTLTSFNRFYQSQEIFKAQKFIENEFKKLNLPVKLQPIHTEFSTFYNVIATLNPQKNKKITISAHYDTYKDYPGADDNASGIAGVIECAKRLKDENLDISVDFVAFCLEEPPFFNTDKMGSFVYAKSIKETNTNFLGVIVFEMIGYYGENQMIPDEFKRIIDSKKGDFIVNVANDNSKEFLNKLNLKANNLKSYNLVTDNQLAEMSDNKNFWKFGLNAIMITDTAFLRNPNYHTPNDTADTLNYENMSKVVDMVVGSIKKLNKED
ncbi:M28 family peptidase [Nautilia sp.]